MDTSSRAATPSSFKKLQLSKLVTVIRFSASMASAPVLSTHLSSRRGRFRRPRSSEDIPRLAKITTFDHHNPPAPGTIPIDKWLHTPLNVYIPAFIWAFNVLKLAIYQEDVAIRLLARSIVRDREAIRDFRHTTATEAELKEAEEVKDPLPPISSFFEVGTGSSLRKDPKWQQFFKDLEVTKKARKEVNKEADENKGPPAVALASRSKYFFHSRYSIADIRSDSQ